MEQCGNAGASLDHCREGEAGPHDEVLDLSLTSEVPGVTEGPAGVIEYPTLTWSSSGVLQEELESVPGERNSPGIPFEACLPASQLWMNRRRCMVG